MNRQTGALIGLTAAVCFLLGLVAAGTRPLRPSSPMPVRPAAAVAPLAILPAESVPTAAPPAGVVDFAAVTARINAAVVNIDTASRGDDRPRASRRYANDDGGSAREASGSGFIIDPAGFILTNQHVVADADRVTVTLGDGRAFKAEVIGTDPAIDVALLRVQAGEPLPVAPLGNSDTLRVGEWVSAIGNPLGVYVHSVTVGVVSFLGRKLSDPSLDAYIQTDAAISVGNSGGPLINAKGDVVGITTAIIPQASNIGFAIPISQVIAILPQLRESGAVARGFIGIGLTNVTPALRRALGLEAEHGALVEDVTPDMPAQRAGMRAYDVIVGADGHEIRSDEALIRYISARAPGTVAMLEVWRDNRLQSVAVKLKDRPLPESSRARLARADDVGRVSQDEAPFGIRVRELDANTAARLQLPETIQGVLVSDVDSAGPARLAQLRTNHVILEINRRRIASLADYRVVVAALRPGEAVAVLVYERRSNQRFICTIVPDN
jgi:serine protease Do